MSVPIMQYGPQPAVAATTAENTGSYHGGKVATMAGQYLPADSLSHQYLVTKTSPNTAKTALDHYLRP